MTALRFPTRPLWDVKLVENLQEFQGADFAGQGCQALEHFGPTARIPQLEPTQPQNREFTTEAAENTEVEEIHWMPGSAGHQRRRPAGW